MESLLLAEELFYSILQQQIQPDYDADTPDELSMVPPLTTEGIFDEPMKYAKDAESKSGSEGFWGLVSFLHIFCFFLFVFSF